MGTCLNCHLSFFLLSIRRASCHICRNVFLICFLGHDNDIEHRLRCFCVLLLPQLRLRIYPAVQFPVMRFPLADLGRVDPFSLVTILRLWILLSRTSLIRLSG